MNAKEYDAAMARIEVLVDLDPLPDTPEGRELSALADQVIAWEKAHPNELPACLCGGFELDGQVMHAPDCILV